MHIKNGKVLNGNSLVPYDGSSEEEDNCSSGSGTSKNQTSNTVSRINVTNGVPKCLLAKDVAKTISNSKELQKANFKSNTNDLSTMMQVTIVDCTKIQIDLTVTAGLVC